MGRHALDSNGRFSFMARWIIVDTTGHLVAWRLGYYSFAISGLLYYRPVMDNHPLVGWIVAIATMAFPGLVFGLVVGVFQWIVIPLEPEVAREWVKSATFAGLPVFVLIMLFPNQLGIWEPARYILIGLFFGFIQWRWLRNTGTSFRLWIIGCTLGWSLPALIPNSMVWSPVLLKLVDQNDVSGPFTPIWASFVVLSLITGLTLLWIVDRNTRSSEASG